MKKLLVLLLASLLLLTSLVGCSEEQEQEKTYPKLVYMANDTVFHEDILEEENERFDRLLKIPEREGYAFGGWFYDEGTWSDPLDVTELNRQKTGTTYYVYAKWETVALTLNEDGRSYTVTGVLDGAEGAVSIPAAKDDLPVVAIAKEAFAGQSDITSITIPSSVKTIGDRAFEGCTALTSVTIPHSVTSLGKGAFSNCVLLENISLSSGMTSVSASTFFNCRSLKSVEVLDGVTKINYQAFYGCTSLTNLTLPSSVQTIGTDILSGTSINAITFRGTQAKWSTVSCTGFANGSSLATVHCLDGDVTLP